MRLIRLFTLPFTHLINLSFLAAFLWSVSQGQYDDDYTPSVRMLFDDDAAPTEKAITAEENNGVI